MGAALDAEQGDLNAGLGQGGNLWVGGTQISRWGRGVVGGGSSAGIASEQLGRRVILTQGMSLNTMRG
jgi:hypothetical protein